MRHLFVPACVCVMTWSGATGSDPAKSLDEYYAAPKSEKRVAADRDTMNAARADIPIDMNADDLALEAPDSQATASSADAQTSDGADNQAIDPNAVPLPPVAKPVVHRSREEVCDTLTKAAETNNLPVPFFISLLFQESRFQPGVVSSAGAQGVAQFMPETAASMGVENPFDPLQAIPASARLLRSLVSQFGNLGLAAAAYNAGPKRIQDWLQKKSKLPDETKGYVKTITGRPAETWNGATLLPGQRLPRHAPCQESAGLYAFSGPATIPLPARSPLRAAPEPDVTVVAAKTSRHRIASIEKNKVASAEQTGTVAKAEPAAKSIVVASADGLVPAPTAPAAPVKIAKHGARVTAVINIALSEPKSEAKPAAKTAAHPAAKQTAMVAKPAAPIHTVVHTAKPADAKPAVQQLAARKTPKSAKPKLDKVATR